MTPTDDTVKLVPLAEAIELARLGTDMRRCQRAYFDARKRAPHMAHDAEWRAALAAERRFDAACRDMINRERVSLPGMEGGEGR